MSLISRMIDGDDTTAEAHIVLASLSILVALFLAGWVVIHRGDAFDVQAFGIGIGSLFGGVGAASWARGKELRDSRRADQGEIDANPTRPTS